MKIWKLSYDYDHEQNNQYILSTKDKSYRRHFDECMTGDLEVKKEFEGVEIERVDGTKRCDFPKLWYASKTLLCSQKAKFVLQDLIGNDVEFIHTTCAEEELYIIHTLCYKNSVDHDASKIRSLSSGLEVEYLSYSFIEERIENANIFKVFLNNRTYSTEIFVTSEFKNVVEQHGLTGIEFVEVWNSDN